MTDAARKRAALLDRLEAVNERAYDEITENGVNGAHRTYQAFIETFDKLDAMYPRGETWYSIANAENAARKGQWDALLDENPAWFKDAKHPA